MATLPKAHSRDKLLHLLKRAQRPDRREDLYRQARAVVREHLGNRGRNLGGDRTGPGPL